MSESKVASRLTVIAGAPLIVLGLLAMVALAVGFTGADATTPLRVVGVIAAIGTIAGSVVLLRFGDDLAASPGPKAPVSAPAQTAPPGQLDGVVRAYEELAERRLPDLRSAVVQSLEPTPPVPFDLVAPDGAIGRLARLVDDVEALAFDTVQAQREAVQASLSDLIVNVVRRNQSLLDRQLGSIDDLERTEQHPERLEQLYGIDLLATRMRRNAESLLVLAGAEPPRPRNKPVAMVDIARVAVSEIEHYRRVGVNDLDESTITAGVVVDLAHLLSELLDNATAFSSPDTTVALAGSSSADGGYEIVITDSGVGMSTDVLAHANRILNKPPRLTLDMSRSIGLIVVGRLAERHGIRVELRCPVQGGTKATVRVPASALLGGGTAGGAAGTTGASTELPSLPLTVRTDTDRAATAPGGPDTDHDPVEGDGASSDALDRLLGPMAGSQASGGFDSPPPPPPDPTEAPATPATIPGALTTSLDALPGPNPFSVDDPRSDDEPAATVTAPAPAWDAGLPDLMAPPATDPPAPPTADTPAPPAAPSDVTPAPPGWSNDEATAPGVPPAPTAPADTVPPSAPPPPGWSSTTDVPVASDGEAVAERSADPDADTTPSPAADPTAADDAPPPPPGWGAGPDTAPVATPEPVTAAALPGWAEGTQAPPPPPGWSSTVDVPVASDTDDRPPSLSDAVPTGSELDFGIESLLDPSTLRMPSPGQGDLAKRDRSLEYAPASEGRDLPGAPPAGQAATASHRSPEEIKSMITDYRDARRSTDDDAGRPPAPPGWEAGS